MLRRFFSKFDEFYIGLVIALFFAAFSIIKEREGILDIPFMKMIEYKIIDKKFALSESKPRGKEVVILAVDQKTFDRFGKWPVEREVFSKAVSELKRLGAKVVAFDIVFAAEMDATVAKALTSFENFISENLKDKKSDDFKTALSVFKERFEGDNQFANSIRDFGNAILGYRFLRSDEMSIKDIESSAPLPNLNAPVLGFDDNFRGIKIRKAAGFSQSIQVISKSSIYAGHINVTVDWDGVNRTVPVIYRYGDELYYSLSLMAVDRYLGKSGDETKFYRNKDGGLRLKVGGIDVPIDENGDLRINYYGPKGKFKYISFADLVDGKADKEDINGKIVLLGATAPLMHDLKPTPFEPFTPGVEIHATLIDNILHKNFLSRNDINIVIFEIIVILLIGMILGLMLRSLPLWTGIPMVIILAAGYIGFDLKVLFPKGKLVITLIPLLEMVVLILAIAFFKYSVSEKKGKAIKDRFKHYVADAVVEEMIAREDLNLGMVKKNLTVLFADIRDFATISEQMDPQFLEKLLNRAMTLMTDAILESRGTVDKYMGDAIMAIFGAPLDLQDHPYYACRAAFRMIEKLAEFNKGLEENGLPAFKIGVGISTGEVLVGNMGSEYLFNYSVLGNEVNIASRIEELNKQFETNIIISASTLEAIGDRGVVRNLGAVKVKGIEREVQIFSLSGIKGS
jgi:adenylate cyclase